jgi:hypothetical protein
MLSKRLLIGDLIPKFYGVSYRDYAAEYVICHPFPFNLLIGWIRPKWLMIRYGKARWETAIELKYQEKLQEKAKATNQIFYEQGRKAGYDQGFHDGIQRTLNKSDFSEKVEVIKAYIINLIQLYLMRVQISGNEMTDEVRSAVGRFLKYEKRDKPKIISRLITSLFSSDKNEMSDLDYFILDRFCKIMEEDLGKMNGKQK